MTVVFKELAGSPVETYQPEGVKAERRLLAAYEDRYAVVAALLGGSQVGDSPQANYPDQPTLVAMRVRVEPFEKRPDNQGAFADLTADLNSYSGQFAEIVVQYETFGADGRQPKLPKTERNTFLTYRMDFGGEYLTLPGSTLQWKSDGTAPVSPEAVPMLRIPITEHHVTWHHVTDPPWDAIRACVGAVNAAAFAGAAAETVLFEGAKADRQFTGLDDLLQPQFGWRITYFFREKSIKLLGGDGSVVTLGWNYAYRAGPAGGPAWDQLVDSDGNTLYRTVDFDTLFQFVAE